MSCDQSGIGFTPIIGVDFKTGKWNFSAKYEFKTRIRLKNKAVNQAPSISALPDNLSRQMVGTLTQVFTNKGMTPENAQAVAANTTQAVLTNDDVVKTMAGLKTEFDTKLEKLSANTKMARRLLVICLLIWHSVLAIALSMQLE